MRRILRPATIVSSFCAAVDGGRAIIAAPFSTANPKPKPHTKPPSHIFGRNQLENEERVRKILFRDYSGRAIKDEDDELADEDDEFADEEEKVYKYKVSFSQEEFNAFLKNLWIECQTDNGPDYEKFESVRREFHTVLKKEDKIDEELDDATQNDRVDKLAEIAAEEELNAFIAYSFVTKLMIECEPKYEKRFREIIEKVRKKMIQDDDILGAFELVTFLMSKCEPVYEKLLCDVLEKVREKITQEGENENIRKIEKLAKLDMKAGDVYNFEDILDKFVTRLFLKNLRFIEEKKSYVMAYEVIEKLAKKMGNKNLHRIAEGKLDTLITLYFVTKIAIYMPDFMYLRRGKRMHQMGYFRELADWKLSNSLLFKFGR